MTAAMKPAGTATGTGRSKGLRWTEVRRDLPARAVPGTGLFDERVPGQPERTGWRIWLSAGGSFRAEDDGGRPVWIVRTDRVTYFDFESGVPSRKGPGGGPWVVKEPVKPALFMLRPRDLGQFFEFTGWTFEVEPDAGGVRVVHMRGPGPGQRAAMSVDLARGLISSIWSPDADPADGWRIREWVERPYLDPGLFRWRGEYRDSRA